MSEVVNGVAEVAGGEELTVQLPSAPTLIAPALRVEELRDDTSSLCVSTTSDEESGFSQNSGDLSGGSDIEGKDAHLPEFKEPEDELKDRIIKQVRFCLNLNIFFFFFLMIRDSGTGFSSTAVRALPNSIALADESIV